MASPCSDAGFAYRIRRILLKAGDIGLTRKQLGDELKAERWRIEPMLNELLQMGLLTTSLGYTGKRGRPSTLYLLTGADADWQQQIGVDPASLKPNISGSSVWTFSQQA